MRSVRPLRRESFRGALRAPPVLTFAGLCASFRRCFGKLMAQHGQNHQGNSAHGKNSSCGAGQTIVELCEVSSAGLIFWSRRRFEVGAEIQVRIRHSELPAVWRLRCQPDTSGEWVVLRGLVVAFCARRRSDGSFGFEVSLLVESLPKLRSRMCWSRPRVSGLRRFGLN